MDEVPAPETSSFDYSKGLWPNNKKINKNIFMLLIITKCKTKSASSSFWFAKIFE